MKRRIYIIETSYYYVDVEVDNNATEEEIIEAAEEHYEDFGADDFGDSYIEVRCTNCDKIL